MKSYTDLEQSKKLAEILPLESADMYYPLMEDNIPCERAYPKDEEYLPGEDIECWSLAALLAILPEINGTTLKVEKVKAEGGYDGYFYPIEYEGIVLIPYPKNPVDACYEMIVELHEQKIL